MRQVGCGIKNLGRDGVPGRVKRPSRKAVIASRSRKLRCPRFAACCNRTHDPHHCSCPRSAFGARALRCGLGGRTAVARANQRLNRAVSRSTVQTCFRLAPYSYSIQHRRVVSGDVRGRTFNSAKAIMSEPVSTSPTVLVTGATDGIGYATARRFVDDGATVYLHAPDQGSGENAMTRLVKDGAEPLRLHLVVADFTRLDEVAGLADTLTATLSALDVLVNNAAVAGPERRTYTAGRPRAGLPGQLPRAVPADHETDAQARQRGRTSRQRVLGDAPRRKHQLEEPGR